MRAIKLLIFSVIFIAIGLAAYYTGYTRGEATGWEDGYTSGVIDGAGTGYDLRDPTYSELKQFIKEDDTDKNEYMDGTFTCSDFAASLNNNAVQLGYNAAYVYIAYPDGSGHAINAFKTVDKGLIFIEPQFDDEVQVEIGSSYAGQNGYKASDHDDTIARYVIVW
ncbi:MAG: hypothetical protein WC333_06195 [Dehalococcoidia bacterium]|jgi:hypothetical protein